MTMKILKIKQINKVFNFGIRKIICKIKKVIKIGEFQIWMKR